jgi:F420-dependent oxidoreductase-like protein
MPHEAGRKTPQLRIMTEPQQGASYEQLLAIARLAEELGFEGFARSDHYLPIGEVDGRPGPTDAWITLAALARETRRIRLATLVSPVTFRPPGPLAIAVAQVDAMSGGRVELGLGAGWNEAEHRAYAIPYPGSLAERFDRLEEQLQVIRGLWETPEGGRFSHPGPHYPIHDSPALPKPAQRPHPPIIVGGFGTRRTPRLAAAHAAEYNLPFPAPEQFSAQMERIDRACERAGRDPASLWRSVCLLVACGATEREAARRVESIRARFPLAFLDTAAVGTAGGVAERLADFQRRGADRIYLQILDLEDREHLALIAAEVRPALR